MSVDDGQEWGGYIEPPEEEASTSPPQTPPEQTPPIQPPPIYPPPSPPPPQPPPSGAAPSAPVPPPRGARAGGGRQRTRLIAFGVIALVVIVAIAAAAAFKGGKKGLSEAAWISRADAICGSTFPEQAADESADNISGATALAQQTLTRIRALGLPTSGASQVKSIESQEQQGTDLLEQAVASASSDPTQARSYLAQAEAAITAAQKAAGQFGMQVCNAGQ